MQLISVNMCDTSCHIQWSTSHAARVAPMAHAANVRKFHVLVLGVTRNYLNCIIYIFNSFTGAMLVTKQNSVPAVDKSYTCDQHAGMRLLYKNG